MFVSKGVYVCSINDSKKDFKGQKTSRGSVCCACSRVYVCVCVSLPACTQYVKMGGNDFVLEYNKYTEWSHY